MLICNLDMPDIKEKSLELIMLTLGVIIADETRG